jgi:hypothetical protein
LVESGFSISMRHRVPRRAAFLDGKSRASVCEFCVHL